jgi:ElaB/YqjD/DUF883 family membrane-anchored ribosome-binding protein
MEAKEPIMEDARPDHPLNPRTPHQPENPPTALRPDQPDDPHTSQRSLVDRVQDAARTAADTVEESVDKIRSTTIDDLAEQASEKGAKLGATVSTRVDEAMSTAGEQISSLGQTVRVHAPDGKPGEIARSAATQIERSGEYLQRADMAQVRNDLEQIIRAHPIEALVVGAGIGYLAARAMRR